ncbi:hypothetical protein EDB86DRAFT_2906272, partial [Lactarius hatsudake]
TRAGIPLPDDVPCFERFCSRTVGRPVKDMIREELDQEEGFNDDWDLDSDSDVDDEDSIIARIQAIHNGKFEVFTETVAAVDPFALTMKRGDKVREAARQAVASVGLKMVVGHQRRFVEDLRSAPTLSLLPMARCTSEGNGAARFTKLVKMMLSGLRADERNIGRIWSSRRRIGAIDRSNVGLQTLSAM